MLNAPPNREEVSIRSISWITWFTQVYDALRSYGNFTNDIELAEGKGIVFRSGGNRFRLSIDNTGTIQIDPV